MTIIILVDKMVCIYKKKPARSTKLTPIAGDEAAMQFATFQINLGRDMKMVRSSTGVRLRKVAENYRALFSFLGSNKSEVGIYSTVRR
jgi:hypothetical protein